MVRPERPEDFDAIRRVHSLAFAPSDVEARLVDELRSSGGHVAELSLAAVDEGGEVIGHIEFSRAQLVPGGVTILVLAPMAVLPEHQGKGVGGLLINHAFERAAATEYPLVSILGHAGYYPRFGCERAGTLGIEPPFAVPPEAWMAYRLPAWSPAVRGTVEYDPAFATVA